MKNISFFCPIFLGHEHYIGPLTREALLAALDDKQRHLLATLETVDINAPIGWDGTPFSFALFTWEFVQHEAVHHGQWSLYGFLGVRYAARLAQIMGL
jgi:hypothetical protein